MSRSTQLLLVISTTFGITILLAWVLVQLIVIRPAIGAREEIRTRQLLEAVDLMNRGISKREAEETLGVDLRVYLGQADAPPFGSHWTRKDNPKRAIWKRHRGEYEIAAWTGRTWLVIHEDLPVTTGLLVAMMTAGLPVIILVFGLSQRANRHLKEAEETLSRIAEGRLHQRLNETAGNKELRRLASAVNKMAAQIQTLVESDRRRMAGLSHELRTPLTRVRLGLELARREGGPSNRLNQVEREIEAFDALLSEMLELSRLELVGEQSMHREVVDLAQLAHDVVDAEGLADVAVHGAGTATVDRTLASRLLKNLLCNCEEHAPGAMKRVNIMDNKIQVVDDGPGIEAGRHGQVLQPFQLGDQSAGHGLGLAIVNQIVGLHDGSISFSTPPGLTVSVQFGAASAKPVSETG